MKAFISLLLSVSLTACNLSSDNDGTSQNKSTSFPDVEGSYSYLQESSFLSCSNGGEVTISADSFHIQIEQNNDVIETPTWVPKSDSTYIISNASHYKGLLQRNGNFLMDREYVVTRRDQTWRWKSSESLEGVFSNGTWLGEKTVKCELRAKGSSNY